jgi:hypothetical protein
MGRRIVVWISRQSLESRPHTIPLPKEVFTGGVSLAPSRLLLLALIETLEVDIFETTVILGMFGGEKLRGGGSRWWRG